MPAASELVPPSSGAPRWVVMKFGGTSVSSRERWETIAAAVQAVRREGARPVIVSSAVSQVSNRLERLLAAAAAGEDVAEEVASLRQRHVDLAAELEIELDPDVEAAFSDLESALEGVRLTREASPRVHARVMATGELVSTRLGAAFLRRNGCTVAWLDARDLLDALPESLEAATAHERQYLSASCSHERDDELSARLGDRDEDVLLTQGFIARAPDGHTALLGRGGSDTSAAYVAARLGAERLEIWTDVPGLFTANPSDVPTARLLRRLDYAEAAEVASMGAKVLHPRCIPPVRDAEIPLHIRCTPSPELEGTIVGESSIDGAPQVKAVSARKGMALVSMELEGSWQVVGLLADLITCFSRHGLSIDAVSSSQTNVTVSLDPQANSLEAEVLKPLLDDLAEISTPRLLRPTATVSLVGRGIRAVLHELGPAMERFEDEHVHLLTQGANDLSLTWVVDEDAVDRLVEDLHAQLFPAGLIDPTFGPSWESLSRAPAREELPAEWWAERRERLVDEAERGTPYYAYDLTALDAAHEELGVLPLDRLLYSVKANSHAAVLDRLHERGVGYQCGSPGEVEMIRERFGDVGDRILYAGHAPTREELRTVIDAGALVALDGAWPLEAWPDLFGDRDILLRIDPGRGAEWERHADAAGQQTKAGLTPGELPRAVELAEAARARVIGLHAHAGSGIRTHATWAEIALLLASLAEEMPDVRMLDVGGGIGVPDRPGQSPIDLASVGATLASFRKANPRFDLWMEPGRFLTARAGVLVSRVRAVRQKSGRTYVTIDAGMNSLLRPALYGVRHPVVNLSRIGGRLRVGATVVGPLCDSGDVLVHDCRLPETHPGDLLLISRVGAYGHALASSYNGREPAREVVVEP